MFIRKIAVILCMFFFTQRMYCQDLELNDLIKVFNMNFYQTDTFLTEKKYILLGKDIVRFPNTNITSSDWFSGVRDTNGIQYSKLKNNHWRVSVYGADSVLPVNRKVEYTIYSKHDYIILIKQLQSNNYKLTKSVISKIGETASQYESKDYSILLLNRFVNEIGAGKYEGVKYIVNVYSNK